MAKAISAKAAGFCTKRHDGEICDFPLVEVTYPGYVVVIHDDGSFDNVWEL